MEFEGALSSRRQPLKGRIQTDLQEDYTSGHENGSKDDEAYHTGADLRRK